MDDDGWSPEAATITGRGRGRGRDKRRTPAPASPVVASPAVAVPAQRPTPFAPGGTPPPAPPRAATWAPAPVWSRSNEVLPSGGGVSISRASVDARRAAAFDAAADAATLATPLLPPSRDVEAAEPPPRAAPTTTNLSTRAPAAASLVLNVVLLAAKLVAFYLSGSKAVLASTVDSVVDIASQAVLAAAESRATTRDPRFPVGRARYTAVGVATAAGIMVASTLAVVWQAGADLVAGFILHDPPVLTLDATLYIILAAAIGVKAGLWAWCGSAARAAPPRRRRHAPRPGGRPPHRRVCQCGRLGGGCCRPLPLGS